MSTRVFTCGQWVLTVTIADDDNTVHPPVSASGYAIANPGRRAPGGDLVARFFTVRGSEGAFYGGPFIVNEPSLNLRCTLPTAQETTEELLITGFVCKGRPELRSSMSNAILFRNMEVLVDSDGSMHIDGERFCIEFLLRDDKNRSTELTALIRPGAPPEHHCVTCIERGDLADLLIRP